jgi:hypothetical protein
MTGREQGRKPLPAKVGSDLFVDQLTPFRGHLKHRSQAAAQCVKFVSKITGVQEVSCGEKLL